MRPNKKLFQFEIENKAAQFRKDNGFGETNPIRLKSLLLKKGITTIFKPLSGRMSGMAIKANKQQMFILINHSHTLGKQHFTIAHELYHLFIQEKFSAQQCITGLYDRQDDNEELKADMFASYLLLPRLGVYELIPEQEIQYKNKISTETIFKIQQYYSVSVKAVIYRLFELEIVDDNYFDKYSFGIKSIARSLGYDMSLYEEGNHNLIISDYIGIASKLYKDRKISESYFLELSNAIGFDPYSKDEENGDN